MKFFFKLFESDTEEETNYCRSSPTSALKFLNITALMVCTLLPDTLFP